MFAPVLRSLRRLHRSAGLGLAAVIPAALAASLYAYELTSPQPLETLLQRGEMAAGDLLRKHGRPAALKPDIVFLGVDDASLKLDGLWPEEIEASPALKLMRDAKGAWLWPRDVYALLLDRLVAAGARLVIFDLVFPRPADGDAAFRAALDRYHDRVVIASQIVGDPPRGTFQQPADTLVTDPVHDPRVGYATYQTDFDGPIRQTSFALTQEGYNGQPSRPTDVPYASLLARELHQLGHDELIPADRQRRFFRYTRWPAPDDRRPVDDPKRANFDYAPYPLWEVFSDDLWKQSYGGGAFFKDKIVMVGAAAPTLHDFQPTPYGQIPGPDLHLQALTAALGQDYLAPCSVRVDFACLLAAGALAWAVGLGVRQPLARLGVFLAVSAGFVGVLQWLFDAHGLLPLAFTPLLVFNTGGMGGLIGEYTVERAEKARVRGVLDRLVSKDIVRELLADPARYGALVRGERRCVTILFSDVRGFTSLTETADDPAAFIAQLNEYLGEMVDVVFKHRGTLDKFIGDAVMAVWGSMHTEGSDADARAAVAAALEMRARLAALNTQWLKAGKTPMEIGIGVNYGEVIVGGLGSEKSKMEITVMGDAVNLASRLEGLTKEYGLDLLVGESVAKRVSEQFRLRTVDLVRVKGKKKPSEVMTVIGPLSEVPTEAQEFLFADYEDAILLYRKQEFAAALRLLEECARTNPSDYLTAFYLERCQALIAEPPAPDWDGVRLMKTK